MMSSRSSTSSPSASLSAAPSLEGYLWKRAGSHNGWRRRYFRLRHRTLIWSKSKLDSKAGSSIPLAHCSASVVPDTPRSSGGRQCCFELSSSEFERVYALQAENRRDMLRWIKAFNDSAAAAAAAPGAERVEDTDSIDLSFGDRWRHEADLSARACQWRSEVSLLGLRSAATHNLHVTTLPELARLDRATCFAVHNNRDLIAMGDAHGSDQGNIQIVAIADSKESGFRGIRKFVQAEGVTHLSWKDQTLVSGSTKSNVYMYHVDAEEGYRSVSLKATYSHSRWMSKQPVVPGRWLLSERINSVELNPLDEKMFVTLENQRMHIWNAEREDAATFSGKASTSPVFSCEWSPHHQSHLLIGGLNKSMKLFDVRSLSSAPEKAVVWKMANAHGDIVRDLSWSPLMRYWVASAGDDGCVKIWDLRVNKGPIRTLRSHTNAVTKVSWSRSQADVLASGGADRTVRHWSLCVSPHNVINTFDELHRGVVGVSFSNVEPLTTFALSSASELVALRMSAAFTNRFAQHRFDEPDRREREIEELIYSRDIGTAFERIVQLATSYWKKNNYERTARLLTLCSSTMFEGCASTSSTSQSKLIRDLCYYIPPNAVFQSSVSPACAAQIQVLRIRLALRKLLESGKYADILSLEDDICSRLRDDENAFGIDTLRDIVRVILPHEYLRALRLALRLGKILRDHRRFNDFIDVSSMLLKPTVYHEQPDQAADTIVEQHLIKKASVALDRDLRNPKIVIPQLQLLYEVHTALIQPDAAERIIDMMEEVHRVLPASVHRIYFNALIYEKNYDKFFILATQLVQLVDGYAFADVIRRMMAEVGFPRLKRFLDTSYHAPESDSSDPALLIAGSLTIVNIIQNCSRLPSCLDSSMPVYLRRFTRELDKCLRGLEVAVANKRVRNVLDLVARIKDNKRISHSYFVEELQKFTDVLNKYVIS